MKREKEKSDPSGLQLLLSDQFCAEKHPDTFDVVSCFLIIVYF